MAYQATGIPVMLASPGDVADERLIIRDVLRDWNDVNSVSARVVLSPVGWESHSAPELGQRPQELINARLLRECDLLIGVFWTRLGTPTGVAPSGTVEEIEEHLDAGKPAMVYFSSRPVAPESIDPKQYEQVREFKELCRSRGLIGDYDRPEDFRRKLSKQLQVTLLHNEFLKSVIHRATEITLTPNSEAEFSKEVRISSDAQELLKAGAKDTTGTIMNIRHMNGHSIGAGGQEFGGSYGRESARWEQALGELVDVGLVVDAGDTGEVFELTHLGWSVADKL